jgi:Leucine-rich repeat (LRR) protein
MSCRRDAVQPGNKACSKRANSGVYEQTCLNGVWHDTDQCLCRGIEIGDIAPLAALTQLEQLALFENHISDLTPLRQQAQLTSLEIGNNCISDLSPLAGLSKLEHLSADFNAIVDASPLSGANG